METIEQIALEFEGVPAFSMSVKGDDENVYVLCGVELGKRIFYMASYY